MQDKESEKKSGTWWEVFKTFFWALVIAMVFKSFVFQPFNIPSGSMKPTLLIGDYLIVSKYSYGYSNHSFPFSPNIINGRLWYTEPKRGDIVVMFVPQQTADKDTYIKRLIGLPGDKIQVKDHVLYINGEPVQKIPDGEGFNDHKNVTVKQFVEVLPNGVKHKVWDDDLRNYDGFSDVDADNTKVYVVPPDNFFMMGDNRDDSGDSRFPTLSFVPKENLIGRAEIILFASNETWNPLKWGYDRFFTILRK